MTRFRARGLLALLAVCAAWPAGASTDTGVTLSQHGGGQLTLPAPAQRMVTLAPHLAELVYLAGAGDRLLATVAYSDHPPAAAELPRIGDAFRFDLERLVDLDPDLVLAWSSGNPDPALAAMEDLGLPVWRTEVRSVSDMAELIRAIGHATGLDTEDAAAAVDARWTRLRARYADRPTLSFFYQVGQRPLYTVNGEHLISQGLAACGARNVFRDLSSLAPQITREAVLQADPDVLVAGRVEGGDDPLAQWRNWPRLSAVRNEALVLLPADPINRATPRLLDAVALACERFEALRAAGAAARETAGAVR